MDGAIESVAFSFPYNKKDPKAKDALYAAFEKKWGKVKSVEELEPHSKIYSEAGPRIEVYEDSYSNGTVTVRVADPKPSGKKNK